MTRRTFDELVNIFRADLSRQATRMREPVPVETRLAIGIWQLATGDSYRCCGLQFGHGMSTAQTICEEFENALCNLKDRYIRFPYTDQEVEEVMDLFEEQYHFPQIVGAIDGCHIEIKAPPENHKGRFISGNCARHY